MLFPFSFQLRKNVLSLLLWPFSAVHLLLVKVRWWLYQLGFFSQKKFLIPIVVVGNVAVGGGGKTPLVLVLIQYLQAQGLSVGVVSRGYGRTSGFLTEVQVDTPIAQSGDEPALIKRLTGVPVCVARCRSEAVEALLVAYPATAVVICDDGLQHYGLARDIEIAVFDNRGLGNGWLLPAGLLREPWPERLNRGVDLVLHTGNQPAFAGFTGYRKLGIAARAQDGTYKDLSSLKNQPLIALAGIASPESFFAMLTAMGLTLSHRLPYADHYSFLEVDFSQWAGQTILCTEKDAVKLFGRPDLKDICLLAVPLEFIPEPAFFAAFDALLQPLLCPLCPLPSSNGH